MVFIITIIMIPIFLTLGVFIAALLECLGFGVAGSVTKF